MATLLFDSKTGHAISKIAVLIICAFALSIMLYGIGRASAYDTADGALARPAAQVAPEQDATISSLTLAAGGSAVTLTPAFDPETTRYTATVNAESVSVQATAARSTAGFTTTVTGDTTVTLTPVTNTLMIDIPLAEGQITDFAFTVQAQDGVTNRTYHIEIPRPAADTVPDITIEANHSEYVAGFGDLVFTLARGSNTPADLEVTVNLVQTQAWLSSTSFATTFHGGSTRTTYTIAASVFSSPATQDGELTATVAPVSGYDVSGARTRAQVIHHDGPAVKVAFEHPSYTIDEDAGVVNPILVARLEPGISHAANLAVSVSTVAMEAHSNPQTGDYVVLSEQVRFRARDFRSDNGAMVARVAVPITILDDNVREEDERFGLELARVPSSSPKIGLIDPDGDQCDDICSDHYIVTIQDNDPEPNLALSASSDRINELGTTEATVTIFSANGSSFATDQTITVDFSGTATLTDDYTVSPADADTADGYQVTLPARATFANLILTAVDDTAAEPCDWLHVSAAYGEDAKPIGPGQEIVIVDREPNAPDGITELTVGLNGIHAGVLTEADNGRDWYSFAATAGVRYIIEVKHPLTFTEIHEDGVGGNPQQVPGYLADPSILEIIDDNDAQVLGEHDQGGFTSNFARAFFAPDADGQYYIKIGAGPQDRTGLGCYTISVRADDHADDFRTDPSVVIRPGESITAAIDSDVAKDDPGLNPWDWTISPTLRSGMVSGGLARPRSGIESLDDRDVFRYRISEAGMYRVAVSSQPTGVGVWYVWDYQGNAWLRATTTPVASFNWQHEPGTYYVEIGTRYESEGNTGAYTVSVGSVRIEGGGNRSDQPSATDQGMSLVK